MCDSDMITRINVRAVKVGAGQQHTNVIHKLKGVAAKVLTKT